MNDETARVAGIFLVPFILLATANSAGYRFGASDLAFYGPAVMRQLEPELFPRDAPLIHAQARLTFMDETVAALARMTTEQLPALFLALYLLTLTLQAVAAASIGRVMYRSRWTTVALLAALTLRHGIPESGTNTLEPYFHPRQLAFGFGALAIAAYLRGRFLAAGVALVGAALLHPTTTLWFAVWVGVAILVSAREWRWPIGAAALIAGAGAVWAVSVGPLAGRLGIMDREWIDTLAEKTYLFPLQWPFWVWLVNLAYGPLIWLLYRRRVATDIVLPRERGLVIGCLSLVAVFMIAVALNAARVALAIQLQPARVFWMLDFLATIYIIGALAGSAAAGVQRPQRVAVALLALAALRGVYVMRVEFPERSLFELRVPGDWGRVTAWVQTTPRDTGWLADPMHASRYGTSVRMAARRDVFVEATKDAAIGMYDRSVALRTRERVRTIGDFTTLSADRARQLAVEYKLDYLITEEELTWPAVFRSGPIRVYDIR